MTPFLQARRALCDAFGTDHITDAQLAWGLEATASTINRLTHAPEKDVRPAWVLALRYMARRQLTCDEAAAVEGAASQFRRRVNELPLTKKETACHLGISKEVLRDLRNQSGLVRKHYYLAVMELHARFADVRGHVATYVSHNLTSML